MSLGGAPNFTHIGANILIENTILAINIFAVKMMTSLQPSRGWLAITSIWN